MAYQLRAVGLDFLTTAPVRLVFDACVPAPPEAVFAAVTDDPANWSWFPTVSGGCYEGDGPYGVGSRRQVRAVGVRMRETVVAWDEPARWAYRVDETPIPMSRALLEQWDFEDGGGRTLVRWTLAADPVPPFGLPLRSGRPIVGRVFRRGMRNLAAQLTSHHLG